MADCVLPVEINNMAGFENNIVGFAGKVDELLYRIWACMSKYDMDNKLSLTRKRNSADDSATLRGKRPDLCITTARALLFKGEDETSEEHLLKAIHDLGNKMAKWKDSFHGKV